MQARMNRCRFKRCKCCCFASPRQCSNFSARSLLVAAISPEDLPDCANTGDESEMETRMPAHAIAERYILSTLNGSDEGVNLLLRYHAAEKRQRD